MSDRISPSHYKLKGLDIEVIDLMKSTLTREEFRGYLKGNIIKYILREEHKGGLEDIKKAHKYITWLIELEEE